MNAFFAHYRRILNGCRFGVPFLRRAWFELPKRVRIARDYVPLAYPAEHGVAIDFMTCFIEDEYGLRESRFPCATILDIGANVGFFALAARSWFPEARIHAYEPNPRVLPYLRTNTAPCHIDIFAEAVGKSSGAVTVIDSGDSNQARTDGSVGAAGVNVVQTAFAAAVERMGGAVDLAKIDCEGAEWSLFEDPETWEKIRHVRMEYHLWNRHPYSEVEAAFKKLGFAILCHRPSGQWGTVWARRR